MSSSRAEKREYEMDKERALRDAQLDIVNYAEDERNGKSITWK